VLLYAVVFDKLDCVNLICLLWTVCDNSVLKAFVNGQYCHTVCDDVVVSMDRQLLTDVGLKCIIIYSIYLLSLLSLLFQRYYYCYYFLY